MDVPRSCKIVYTANPVSRFVLLTMVFLIDRKLYTKAKAIHHLALLFLILWWILALIFQSLAAKIYGALLIVAVIVIEIRFRKSRAQGQASLHLHS